MKTSNKILLTAGLVIVSVLLASVIWSRVYLNKYIIQLNGAKKLTIYTTEEALSENTPGFSFINKID